MSQAAAISLAASFWVHYLLVGHFLTLAISAVIFFPLYAVLLHIKKDPLVLEMESKAFTTLKKFLI